MSHLYDQEPFFDQYAQMARSREGLSGAGEWHQFKALFPDLTGHKVLDLGCGYGWHCLHAAQNGAERVLGIDQSERMIREAQGKNSHPRIDYRICGLEEYETYDSNGKPQHWPIDNYFYPGARTTRFLGQEVVKQHHTLTQILTGLLRAGFRLEAVEEAMPSADRMNIPGLSDEMRRPMMLLARARK